MQNRKMVSGILVALSLLVGSFSNVWIQQVEGQLSYCQGKPNLNPIQTDPPKFVKEVPNGKLYTIGTGDETISLVHVWGNAYQMGYAYGTLLQQEVLDLIPAMLTHFEEVIEADVAQYIGEDMAFYVAEWGLQAGLDLTYYLTIKYSPSYFFDEMRGISDASGVDYNTLVRIHMLPELVKASCSIFGAWSSATADGSLYQLRALDWDTTGPLQKYPVVTIYHPDSDFGHPFANVGWAGWVASITGMSSNQMAMSQKVTDHEFGATSRIGIPFNFLMRDVIQWDADLDAAISRMASAARTCAIWLGCGDGKPYMHRANIFQYSYSNLLVIDPQTKIPYPSNDTKYTHPLIEDVVYWGVNQRCFSALLQQQHGNITGPNTIKNIIPLSKTGDLHTAIFDLTSMHMYVANARADGESGPLPAYDRPFVFFDMNALFNEKPPSNWNTINDNNNNKPISIVS